VWRSFYVFVRNEKNIENFENPISGIDQSARDIGSVKVRRRPRDTVFLNKGFFKFHCFIFLLFLTVGAFLKVGQKLFQSVALHQKSKKESKNFAIKLCLIVSIEIKFSNK
jgi:hypothetical protein